VKAPERPRLYLVVPPEVDRAALEAALDGGDIACVEFAEPTPALIDAAQDRGVAALARDDAARAVALGCDGVYLTAAGADLAAARAGVGEGRIVAAFAGASRHRAMVAGEAGADVVALDPALIPWWVDLFEVPCLARDATGDAVAALVAAGVDFLGVEAAVWNAPEGPATAIRRLNEAVDRAWASC
jgi:thiamine-phosphate pyrophosphorylase